MITPERNVIVTCVVWPALTAAFADPDIGGSVTIALTVNWPGGMFASVQTLPDRLVKVWFSCVPSLFVPSTVTVTLLKSKFGSSSTSTSTMSVPVSTEGGGGGGGGGGSSVSGGGGGKNSRSVSSYSNRSGLPASSRTPNSSINTLSTFVAVAMSATKGTASAARNFSRQVLRSSPDSGPVNAPVSVMRPARRPRSCRKSPSSAGTPCWTTTSSSSAVIFWTSCSSMPSSIGLTGMPSLLCVSWRFRPMQISPSTLSASR